MSIFTANEPALRQRWNPRWNARTDLAALRATFETAVTLAKAPGVKLEEIRRPGHLSPKGAARSLRTMMAGDILATLRSGEAAVVAARKDLAAQREALGKPKVDRADLVAELKRQEARTYLRSLSPPERIAALLNSPDPLLAEAALSAPPSLSGVGAQEWEDVRRHHVETHFAEELAALDERESAIEAADVALQLARAEMQAAVGLSAPDFGDWWESGQEPAEAA